ncbi:MAG TPA: prolyl oligopeptidase family serine peptidase [Polyangiales bacterium]|nr:prolyl oligopeptidase family serine peptidase [Polyangiales bacterium]
MSSRQPPATERRPVTDVYHGVSVADPYRWLEADDDPAVKQWSDTENTYTRGVLDRLRDLPAIRARTVEVYKVESPSYRDVKRAGSAWFIEVAAPPKQQPYLGVMPAGGKLSELRVLLDPNQLDVSGRTAIDWYVPSPDGKRVAVSISKHGTESGDVGVVDVESGKLLPDNVERVNGGTAGGDVAWLADGSGFFYTRYPRKGERAAEDEDFYQQVYFHALGSDAASDRYELGKELPRIAEVQLELDPASGRLLVSVQNGDGGEVAHYLRDKSGSWRQLAAFADQIAQVTFAPHDRLLVVSRRGAPRGKLLVTDARAPDLTRTKVLVPEADVAIVSSFMDARSIAVSDARIYLTYQLGGPSEIRVFDHTGKPQPMAAALQVASVYGLMRDGSGVLFASESFVDPAAWYRYDEKSGHSEKTDLAERPPLSMSDAVVTREIANSKDGTHVPFTVLMPKGAPRDGTGACIATGYGGYGLSIEPRFRLDNVLWLDQGVALAVANLRGGGEFGDAWHEQGRLEHKQNVFDDFAAVLKTLAERGYTRPERLGIIGGSNGGLLMGATFTQHPELMRAVTSFVGIYDMLRVELQPNGAFNTTEFGSVRDAQQFSALYAYSPYHHVTDGAAYPAVLLVTGENDPRVGPLQTRKMAARLQAAAIGGRSVLYRSNAAAGHGNDMSLDDRITQRVDVMAFMLDQLSVPFHASR